MYHYYMFHKPYGCVCARRDDLYPTVMDYFKELNNENLSPVGRLDRETEGLLFITDDGHWNQIMTHPSNQKEKLYEFIAMGTLTDEKIARLENGLFLNQLLPQKLPLQGQVFFLKFSRHFILKYKRIHDIIVPNIPL